MSSTDLNWWANVFSIVGGVFTIAGAIFTIVGVIIAVIIYRLWKKDYKSQHAHTYALDLLKKMKCLHLEIELLRKPKFYHPNMIIQELENKYIPQIEQKILEKLIEIQVDLLVAKNILIRNRELQLNFHSAIRENIINKLNTAVYMFYSAKNQFCSSEFDFKNCDLFKIIFPTEVMNDKVKIKKSDLGTEVEIIDDEFNKIIENNFKIMYSALEDNLI